MEFTQPALNMEDMRSVMRRWASGVAVLAASHDGVRHGVTVNSFTSVSLQPALISVSLQKSIRIHELALHAGFFALTILSENQADLSNRFAGRDPQMTDRFAGLATQTLSTGAPLLPGGLAWMDCRVAQTFDAGINTLFIAEVVAARAFPGKPLLYHDRDYWTLARL